MNNTALLPDLFRTEYRKLVSVLCKLFGISYLQVAEDIVSDTFLLAAETWGLKGLPDNPVGWLYAVSKNKAIDFIRRHKLFTGKIVAAISETENQFSDPHIDLSIENIADSQLQMMFTICNPCISAEAQIGLSLQILCGFGIDEIADAFLTNKEVIYKRLSRAKEKLKIENIKIELPSAAEINNRLEKVLTTLYLLFNEGYYSASQNAKLRKEFCVEAMRLTLMLAENEQTNTPSVNALLALMCFHASRFDARINAAGDLILYSEQDENLWNKELIDKGIHYLNLASQGKHLSKFHLEAAIAYWHTYKRDSLEKWENILQLYNKLLRIEYSPAAALNRTYALAKANGKTTAIVEAEKLNLINNHLYFSLLGNLYTDVDNNKALKNYCTSLELAKTKTDKKLIKNYIEQLHQKLVSSS